MDLSEFVSASKGIGLLGVRVGKGENISEWLLEPDIRRNVYSIGKSVTACAVGFAIEEGIIKLEERLVDAFKDDIPKNVSENLESATVRDLLTMCLGQDKSYMNGNQRPYYQDDNWVRHVLAIPFVYKPGEKFVYNNVGPYLAGMLIQRRAGITLIDYLMPRLFGPLDIKRPTWETDSLGYTFCASGLMLTLKELHRFGELLLNGGIYNGKRIISDSWIKECTKPQSSPNYGYLFWRGEYNSFRADGKYCQLAIIFPEKDAVIATTAECRDSSTMMKNIYKLLYPQL